MTFAIEKHNIMTNKMIDYGSGYSKEDLEKITKGYKYRRVTLEEEVRWFERANSDWIFIATVEG